MNAPVSILSHGLWSLWEMVELDIGRLMTAHNAIVTYGQAFAFALSHHAGGLKFVKRDIEELHGHLDAVADIAAKAELPVTVRLANALKVEMQRTECGADGIYSYGDRSDLTRLDGATRRLQDIIKTECEGRLFLSLGANSGDLWNPSHPPFGREVHDAFPSAEDDIYEAGKCLAVERGTACVMHMMRATEVPLKVLASALNVGAQNDWGSYIRLIDQELDARLKATGKRTADEAFYTHASISFERVKRGWRNSTMHVDQTYTVERAREIFDATKSFMRHLASRMSE